MKAILFALAFLIPTTVLAEDPAPSAALEAAAVAPAAPAAAPVADVPPAPNAASEAAASLRKKQVTREEIEALINGDVDVSTATDDAKGLVQSVGTLKKNLKAAGDDRMAKLMALAAFLAGLFKLLLSGVKVLSKYLPVLATKKGKAYLKYSTVALGALVGLAANVAYGVSIPEAFMLAGSGPLSIAIHEYTKDSKDSDESKKA